MRAPTGGGVCTRDGARLEGGEEVRETKIVVQKPRKRRRKTPETASQRSPRMS
jgi:hypothetical protein